MVSEAYAYDGDELWHRAPFPGEVLWEQLGHGGSALVIHSSSTSTELRLLLLVHGTVHTVRVAMDAGAAHTLVSSSR